MTVAEVLEQIKTLSVAERKELIKQVVDMLDEGEPAPPRKHSLRELRGLGKEKGNDKESLNQPEETAKKHSILELAGLGKEVWEGIDAQEYINQLRSEWDDRP